MKVEYSSLARAVPVVLLTSCLFYVTGCSSDDKPAAKNTSGTSAPAVSGGQTTSHPFADALAGSWLAPCDNSSSGSSKQQQLTASGTTAVMTMRDYSDLDCQTPATPAVRELTFSLAFPGGTTTTPLGEATKVDLTPESSTFDGQPPTAEQSAQVPSAVSYDILLIADAKLYSGHATKEQNGSTADKRPDTLETSTEFVFVRQ